MSLTFQFHRSVHGEVHEAYSWYEEQRPGLGADFLDELERTYAAIDANPARFGFVERDIREGALKRFPYAIYYRVLTDRIRVLSVHHCSRDPSSWRGRK